MKLELFKRDTCPYCIRVSSYIQQAGIADKIDFLDISFDEAARKRLVEEGGKQQVPCLFIDGKPLYESMDIINWLKINVEEA